MRGSGEREVELVDEGDQGRLAKRNERTKEREREREREHETYRVADNENVVSCALQLDNEWPETLDDVDVRLASRAGVAVPQLIQLACLGFVGELAFDLLVCTID